jgi:23S rRNA pseudouridine2605 synthase
MEERLQKILSQWGIASRRQAEQMILEGRVRLNGALAQIGQKANPTMDAIEVDGILVQPSQRPQPIYLLLHKPKGVVTTCSDPWQRLTVIDLLSPDYRHVQGLHPVGRLDIDTTGALLITNDGRLTFCLTHPRHHVAKTYQVWLEGDPPEPTLQKWRDGVVLSGRLTLPAQVQVLKRQLGNPSCTCLEVVLKEGRNRQIRRVAEQLGFPVRHLHRTAIGPVQLQPENEQELPSGHYRLLSAVEFDFLQALIKRLSVKQTVAADV